MPYFAIQISIVKSNSVWSAVCARSWNYSFENWRPLFIYDKATIKIAVVQKFVLYHTSIAQVCVVNGQ